MYKYILNISLFLLSMIMLSCNNNSVTSSEQKQYELSGTITGTDSVAVSLSGDESDTQICNDGGSYLFNVESGGNYVVTPSKTGYTFSPMSRTFQNVSSDQIQNFVASPRIDLVTIPGGTFQMGDIQGFGVYSDEKPVHMVTIR